MSRFKDENEEIIDRKSRKEEKKRLKKMGLKPNGKPRMKLWKKILITIATIIVLAVGTFSFLLYGPYSGFRDWWITTAMTTMTHQYLATWFFDQATIDAVLANNKVEEFSEDTDTSLIKVEIGEKGKTTEYSNKYEKQLFAENLDWKEYGIYADKDDYRIIKIKGEGYDGYLAAIYDPSKIKTCVTKSLGTTGQYLKTMANDHNAQLAINGGGFEDLNFNSNGATPLGVTFSNGKLISSRTYNGAGGLIGFNKDNKLVLSKMTEVQAQAANIRDGVTFGPFLIVNGKKAFISGNGGWGTAPRSAIGQRQDGTVLLLVIDGRTVTRPGADMLDLTDIMEKYGAYNASNLDGGTSSVMIVNGDMINDPIDSTGAHKTRFIATGFYLTK